MLIYVLHDRTGRLEKTQAVAKIIAVLHDRTGRLEKFTPVTTTLPSFTTAQVA